MPLFWQNNKVERMSQIVIAALTKYLRKYSFYQHLTKLVINF